MKNLYARLDKLDKLFEKIPIYLDTSEKYFNTMQQRIDGGPLNVAETLWIDQKAAVDSAIAPENAVYFESVPPVTFDKVNDTISEFCIPANREFEFFLTLNT